MSALIIPLLSLLFGTALLLVGIGLLFPVLGLRATLSGFPVPVTGLIMSAYFVGFMLGTYVCPAIIRRVGHIRAFAAMASVASTMPILHALAVDPWFWAALRLVTGVCLVGLYMVIESWLNALVPNEQRGRVFATYMSVTLVAMAAGQMLILVGPAEDFLPFAVVSVLVSFALVPVTFTQVREPQPVSAPRFGLRSLYTTSPLGVVGAVASGMLNGAFYGMGAVFAQRVGFSEGSIAAFMGATIIGGAILQWPIGHLSDHRDRRRVMLGVCMAAAALAASGFFIAPLSERAFIALAFLYGGFVFTIYGLSVAHVNDLIEPSRLLEAAGGLLLMHGLGAAVGPTAAGLLMSALGPGSLMIYFTVVLAVAAAFALHRLHVAPRDEAEDKSRYVPMASSSSQAVLQLDPRASARGATGEATDGSAARP